LRHLAGANVHFLGWQPDSVIRDHLRCCRALLFPGEEDFGIVPVESMATGTPVIAFGQGGATETVVPLNASGTSEPTGVWFSEQSTESLIDAILLFERHAGCFDPSASRNQALRFATSHFEQQLFTYLDGLLAPGVCGQRKAA
jgi:glycosyltransferase involved in cell wall biosynthesis